MSEYASKVSVRLDDELRAAVAALELRGLSQSEAIRTLIRLGASRAGELPDGFAMGVSAGREQGRREVIEAATVAVQSAMLKLTASLESA